MKKIIASICIIIFSMNFLFDVRIEKINALENNIEEITIENKDKVENLEREYENDVNEDENVVLNFKEESITLLLGSNTELDYSFESERLTEYDLEWFTSDEKIVQVINGTVSGILEGKATITVETKDKTVKDEINIEVVRNNITESEITTLQNDTYSDVNLESNKSYEIVNNTEKNYNIIHDIKNENSKFNIIAYDKENNIKYSRINDQGDIYIESGEKIEIEAINEENEIIKIPEELSENITVYEIPLFYEYTFLSGRTYKIENDTEQQLNIMINYDMDNYDKRYSYKLYYIGGGMRYKTNDYVGGSISLQSSEYIKFKVEDKSTFTGTIPYEYKECISEINEALFYTVDFENNKIYQIINNSNIYTHIAMEYDNTKKYHYIKYNENDEIMNIRRNYSEQLYCARGEKIKLNSVGNYSNYIPIEYKNYIKEVEGPLFYEKKIKSNQTYEIINPTNKSVVIFDENEENRYDYISYDHEGPTLIEVDAFGSIGFTNQFGIKFNIGERESYIGYIPYEFKDFIKEINEPLFNKFRVSKDETYEIVNDTDRALRMFYCRTYNENQKRESYDYILYDDEGKFEEAKKEAYSDIMVRNEYSIKFSSGGSEGYTAYIPYEYKVKIKKYSKPLFYEKELTVGQNYKINNDTNKNNIFLTDAGWYDPICNLIYYDENGSVSSQYTNGYLNQIMWLPSGYSASITVKSGKSIKLYIPYELIGYNGALIESVKVKDTIGWYDILENELKMVKNSKKQKNIVVDVNWNGEEKGKVLLRQGDKTISSIDGTFNIVPGEIFDIDKDIYAVTVNSKGVYSKAKKLRLKIVNSNITIGRDKLAFEEYLIGMTSGDTPIISAINFQLSLMDLPITSELDQDSGVIKIILGLNLNEDEDEDGENEFDEIYKKMKQQIPLEKTLDYSIYNKWGFTPAKVSGYIECKEVNEKLIVISGGINLSGGGELSFKKQTLVGPVPVYIRLTAGMDLGASADILNIDSGKLNLSGSINLSPEIIPELGGGVPNVLSAGVKGDLKFNSTINLNPIYSKFSLTGGIGIMVTAMGWEKEIPIVNAEWAIDGKSRTQNLLNSEVDSIYDINEYRIMERDYVDNTSEWSSSEVSNFSSINTKSNESMSMLQSGVLPTTEPIIATVSNKKILIYLRDNESRSAINRTELVYSIYNEETDSWDNPKAICDDKTADFYPSIAYDDNNLFVAWQNIKNVMSDSSTLEDLAKDSEIVVSKFDINNNSFAEQTTLTNNTTLDIMPKIATSNGRAYVTWINNSSNDIFGIEGINKLMSSSFNGSKWSVEKVLVNEVKNIDSIDIAYNEDKVNIVYSMDTDGDLNTIDDKELYYIASDSSASKRLTDNSLIDSNPKLISNETGLGIIWYSDGKLLQSNSIDILEGKDIFEGYQYTGNDRFKVIQNNNNLAIIWNKNTGDSIETFGSIYDISTGKMGKEIKLTNTENRVKSISGIFDSEGKMILAANIAEKIQKEVDGFTYYDDGDSSLCVTTIKPSQDIRINKDSISVDDSEFIVNKDVPLYFNVENTGQKLIKQIKVDISENNIQTGEVLNSSKIIDINLASGDNIDVESYFTPKEAKNYDIQIKVTPVEGEDVYIDDNIAIINVGTEDIAINKVYNSKIKDKSYLNVNISNVSSILTNEVTLNIREDSKEGQVLYTKQINNLYDTNEYIESIELDKSNMKFDENGEKVLFVEIIGASNEKNLYNNYENIIIDKDYLTEDINKDDQIDILDIALVAEKYNTSIKNNKEWDYSCDINLDGIIDIFDLILISKKAS